MEDYPRNLAEFESRFSTEAACREYLFKLRWPRGFVCCRCGSKKAWRAKNGKIICSGCKYGTTVTAGTIFQDSHQSLRNWFRAIWWVTNEKTGISALSLKRLLGLGSYRTAWAILHKLRTAMVRPGREQLSKRVEVDDAYVGGQEEGIRGRHLGKKALIVVAAEEDGKGIGRIRIGHVADASSKSLHGFIEQSIEPGSFVHTDDWTGYQGLKAKEYKHKVTPVSKSKRPAHQLMPRVHRVVSLLKRWLMGTHQGAVSHEHLQGYLNEFTFRFNRRTSTLRGKLFFRLVQQSVAVEPVTYETMIKGVEQLRQSKHTKHNI